VIGEVLDGRYRVLGHLGEGAMGEVYLALHLVLGRHEALKILRPPIAADPRLVARFRREARALNRLRHPGIVGVHDFGQLPDGRFYLAMELARGASVASLLHREGALPVPRALGILEQLADAVDHAHRGGVVHRDLKPANLVLLDEPRRDQLKVLDFGIAKIIAPDDEHTGTSVSSKDEVFGTPAYMAPELFQGVRSDPRSDLYAIGAIAYELLAGAQPFTGSSMELMHAHLVKLPERLRTRRPEVPPELENLIMWLLDKDPSRRPETGAEVAEALSRMPGFEKPGPAPRRRRASPSGDFETIDTQERPPALIAADLLAPDLAPTLILAGERLRSERQSAIRELAALLVDLGANDLQLALGMAHLGELEDELTQLDIADSVDEARADALDRGAREREAAMRFTLGELRFERQRSGTSGLDEEILLLERRLGEAGAAYKDAIHGIGETAIERTLRRAAAHERLDEIGAKLERLALEIAGRFADHPDVARAAERLLALRQVGTP
jgi:eukaryotic-like serine/threonine-protein kinase